MPTKKQRRRRAKELRHEWEEVFVDETGREIAPDEVDEIDEPQAGNGKNTARGRGTGREPRTRGGRRIEPPSWRRVAKRAALFAPVMLIFITLIDPGGTLVLHVAQTLQLMLLFIPFSYAVDALAYRASRRRLSQAEAAAGARRR